MSRTSPYTETESRLMVPRAGGRRFYEKCTMITNEYGVSFRGDENGLKLTVVMVV
jgi:hypothetical protein